MNFTRKTHVFTPHACARGKGISLSVCRHRVSTETPKSRVLGIYVCCKHNQSVDIGEKLACTRLEFLKKAYQCYKLCISVQHACGISTTPTFLVC